MSSLSTVPQNESIKPVAIDDNVFLANMTLFTKHSILKEFKIMRVLTLTEEKPNKLLDRVPGVLYKHISLNQKYTNHIILLFDECYQFINEAKIYDENIVIMSKGNESMNVTILIAFIMKAHRISAMDALIQVQQKWKLIPLPKFVEHLYLWQKMEFRLKSNEPLLRRVLIDWFRLKFELLSLRLNSDFDELRYAFVSLSVDYIEIKDHIDEKDTSAQMRPIYYCLNCKRRIFYEINTIHNEVYSHCDYIYTEPINWILGMTYKIAKEPQDFLFGQIVCPKCEKLIGVYDWTVNNGCPLQCTLHSGLQRYLNYRFFAKCVKSFE